MSPKAINVILGMLVVGWIVSVSTLFPLPSNDVRHLEQNRQILGEIVTYEAKGRSLSKAELDAAIDDQIAKEGAKAWMAWSLRLVAIIIGVFGALGYLSRRGQWYLWFVLVGIAAHFVLWVWPFAAEGVDGMAAFRAFSAAVLKSGSWVRVLEFMALSVLFPLVEILAFLVLVRQAIGLPAFRRQ